MSTKTITITENAYKKLKFAKKEGESFSEVIDRKFGNEAWYNLVGLLSKEEAHELKKAIKERRIEDEKMHEKRMQEIIKRLSD